MHVCVLTLYIILVFLFIMRVLRKPSSRPLNLKFFRKPTSPPLPLREGPPLISVFFNSLYDPFGSPCRGQKPQGRRGNRSSLSLWTISFYGWRTIRGLRQQRAAVFCAGWTAGIHYSGCLLLARCWRDACSMHVACWNCCLRGLQTRWMARCVIC